MDITKIDRKKIEVDLGLISEDIFETNKQKGGYCLVRGADLCRAQMFLGIPLNVRSVMFSGLSIG